MSLVKWGNERWHSIWHNGLHPRSVASLTFALACVGIATLVRIGLGLVSPDSAVFAPYYSATLVAALVGGATAGGVAALFGGIIACWLFVPPEWSLAPFVTEQLVSFISFCCFLSGHYLRRTKLSWAFTASSRGREQTTASQL